MDAWIETSRHSLFTPLQMSHPVWVRGLKLLHLPLPSLRATSHPVWVRGLKLSVILMACLPMASHPVWVRGLKLVTIIAQCGEVWVAPRVGAWIETTPSSVLGTSGSVAPRVDAKISYYPYPYIIETVQFKLPHQNQASYYRYSSLKQS